MKTWSFTTDWNISSNQKKKRISKAKTPGNVTEVGDMDPVVILEQIYQWGKGGANVFVFLGTQNKN